MPQQRFKIKPSNYQNERGWALGGKNRDRYIAAAPVCEPFYTHGDTYRGDHHLEERGFYVVDQDNKLHGPFHASSRAREYIKENNLDAQRPEAAAPAAQA